MDRVLRTTLMVLGILVLAALLFFFGMQLYWMVSGSGWGAIGPMGGHMMGGRWGMHPFGGMGFGWIGPLLGIGLLVLLVLGIVALARGGRSDEPRP